MGRLVSKTDLITGAVWRVRILTQRSSHLTSLYFLGQVQLSGPASQGHPRVTYHSICISTIYTILMRVQVTLGLPLPWVLSLFMTPVLHAGQTGDAGVQWSELSCELITHVWSKTCFLSCERML